MPRRETHTECLERMFSLRRFGIKLGLATIRRMLAGLGNPHQRYSCIHISGTNGKGSVASSLAAVLMCSGYRVGLYTSPHLVRSTSASRSTGRISVTRTSCAFTGACAGHSPAAASPPFSSSPLPWLLTSSAAARSTGP